MGKNKKTRTERVSSPERDCRRTTSPEDENAMSSSRSAYKLDIGQRIGQSRT